MITQILTALNNFLDRQTARQDALDNAARRLSIALLAASKSCKGNDAAMAELARLAGAALQASDRDDLEQLKRITSQLEEFIG